jgi:signal transduction histidine kinase
MILFLSMACVAIGILVLLAALISLRRLMPVLSPTGSMRRQWNGMAVLIVVFIAAFLGCLVVLWTQPAQPYLLFMSSVLLLGAIAGWLMARLSLQTAVEMRQVENELVRSEKLALLGQVADTVGHELRNPLGVMNNAIYFLQTVLADADETTREYLGIIKDEIADAERIVSDLLDAVRTKPPRPERVEVATLIGKAVGKCDVPENVTLHLDIPDTLPAIRVDPAQMHQVFWNLITNGVEAMAGGGVLEIRAAADRAAETVTVRVTDHGSGITAEHRARLFQPMFTTKARRVGLGLVVVKNLAQANGGSVGVESEPGRGSTFSVSLPCDTGGVL